MSKTWLTSDWHLRHKNIIAYENRPEDYEDQIIKSLSVVKAEDFVINIGDLYLGNSKEFLPLFKQIYEACPGYGHATKILISGNHDALSRTKYASIGMVFLESITIQGVYISHHGVTTLPSDANSQIFGHYHSNPAPITLVNGRKFSIEEQNYKLVELNSFLHKVPIMSPASRIVLR